MINETDYNNNQLTKEQENQSLNKNNQGAIMLQAKKIETKTAIHDDIIIDNYRWMEDVENNESKIMAYVDAENQFTKESLKHTEEMQKELLKELSSRVIKSDQTIYEEIDEYLYYYRKVDDAKLKNYYRKNGENGIEELVLDLNKVDNGNNYSSIHSLIVSPDHKFIGYLIDKDGSEMCELFIQEISSGKVLEDTKSDNNPKTILNFLWASNNLIIYSSFNPETDFFQFIYRHELFTPLENDILIFTENINLESGLEMSACKNYITNEPYTSGGVKKEIHYLDLKNPYGDFVQLAPYKEDVAYDIVIGDDTAFIVKFEKGHSEIIIKKLSDDSDNGEIFYTPGQDCSIVDSSISDSISISKDFVLFIEKENGQDRIKVTNIHSKDSYYIELPEDLHSIFINKVDYKNNLLRLSYGSFKVPQVLLDFNLETKEKVLIRENKIKDYIPEDFVSQLIFAKADDGTLIPINLFYKKNTVLNGSSPLYLDSYGNYGACFPYANFNTSRLLLAEKGVIYAAAYVRGGGFYGDKWHKAGKLFNKINSFTDLINCAEHLIQTNYTTKDKLIISGTSAGGTLVLGAVNMRPDLFKIVIAGVPMADVLGQMLEQSTWAFKEWHYPEWGNPATKAEYEAIKAWCPYSNIKTQIYPHILVTAGLNDTRVDFGIPLKHVAKLREYNQGNNSLLINIADGGHAGEYDNLGLEYAFIFDILGIKM